jgi:hypothetical protein
MTYNTWRHSSRQSVGCDLHASEEGLRMAVGHTVAQLHAVREGRGVFLHHGHSEGGAQVFILGELQHRKYERRVGNEEAEWPVTGIFVSSLKKLGKVEEGASGAAGGSEFSEEISDADMPF